jgi:hypothetical protein
MADTADQRLAATATRLSAISVRAFTNPHTRFSFPAAAPRDWLAMPTELLSLDGDGLTDGERWQHALLEAVHFFSLNIAGERELMQGLAARLYTGALAAVSDYLQHFLAEENAHTVIFARFCFNYANKIYPSREIRLQQQYLPGEEDFLFFAKVLLFEEIANWWNQRIAGDATVWPLAREINEYHALDEARHIAFGRQAVEALWERHAPSWPDEARARIGAYLVAYVEATQKTYVNPSVWRDLGPPFRDGDLLARRAALLARPERRALDQASAARGLEFLRERGIVP